MNVNVSEIKLAAQAKVLEERQNKAKDALVKKYRELALAQDVVKNCERDIADLEASIEDGSFTA